MKLGRSALPLYHALIVNFCQKVYVPMNTSCLMNSEQPPSLSSIWHLVTTLVGEGNGTPLQYSCLENPMDGGAWKAAVHGVAEGWTQLRDSVAAAAAA